MPNDDPHLAKYAEAARKAAEAARAKSPRVRRSEEAVRAAVRLGYLERADRERLYGWL